MNLQKQMIFLPHCNLTIFFVPKNDANFGGKFKNHAQLKGLITKLVEEVHESLEASEYVKTNYCIISLQFDKFFLVPQNDANFGGRFKNHAQLQN